MHFCRGALTSADYALVIFKNVTFVFSPWIMLLNFCDGKSMNLFLYCSLPVIRLKYRTVYFYLVISIWNDSM